MDGREPEGGGPEGRKPGVLLDGPGAAALSGLLERLPPFAGRALTVEFRPELSAYRGRLESGSGRGKAVLAASYIPGRRMVLDSSLRAQPVNLARLATHELFHFVWVRLSNPWRRSFEDLLAAELRRGARGELGWSAEWRKGALRAADVRGRSRRWREYAAESFCDTAAWVYRFGHHPEFTLGRVYRERRRQWFSRNLSRRTVSI